MTIIMLAICPTNVIMGMSLTGYPISGNHGNRHETKMVAFPWVDDAIRYGRALCNWGRVRFTHLASMCKTHPSPITHAEGLNKKNGRLKTDDRMLFGGMLQIVPVPNWAALAMSYSSSSAWRFLLASYSSRVTTSSMRRLMPATSRPVMAVKRSVTHSFTSSKIAGA